MCLTSNPHPVVNMKGSSLKAKPDEGNGQPKVTSPSLFIGQYNQVHCNQINSSQPLNKPKRRSNNRNKQGARSPPMRAPTDELPDMKKSSPIPIPVNSGRASTHSNGSPFAGAKFSDPPSPKSLPKPPNHWVVVVPPNWEDSCSPPAEVSIHDKIAADLKTMLKVQN